MDESQPHLKETNQKTSIQKESDQDQDSEQKTSIQKDDETQPQFEKSDQKIITSFEDQTEYNEYIKGVKFTLFTGGPGTGKTTLLNKFVKKHSGRCIIISPTWQSAKLVNGQTLYNYCNCSYLHFKPKAFNREYILIDEVFMFSQRTMGYILSCIQTDEVKKVIMFGDPFQLKPPNSDGYFYEAIDKKIHLKQLTTYYRCAEDPKLQTILQKYRVDKKFIINQDKFKLLTTDTEIRDKVVKENGIILVGKYEAMDKFLKITTKNNKLMGADGKLYRQDQTIFTINQYGSIQNKYLLDGFNKKYMCLKFINSVGEQQIFQIAPIKHKGEVKYNIKVGDSLVVDLVQGQTLRDIPIIIDSASFFQFGSFYTAISRTNKFDNIYLIQREGFQKIFETDVENIYC